jgi:dihydropteroate synthase
MIWRCRDRTFDVDERPLVMGVLNVTPDSFSDGGVFLDPERAAGRARAMVREGADIVDVGAESTRPGSGGVPPDEQWRRLEPVLERLRPDDLCLSVDTSSAEVAERALAAGARIVNDVTALGDPAMAAPIAASGAGFVLMHIQGTPATMQREPRYEDVAGEVRDALARRLEAARAHGIAEAALAVDPGIGFGKTLAHNLELIARLDELAALGRPVLVGVSRKSFIARLLDLPVDERLEAGLAAAAVAVFGGARIVRTHDVRATVRAVAMADALRRSRRAKEHLPLA